MTLFRNKAAWSSMMLLALACGCGSRQPWEVAHPASGSVSFKGKAIAGAELTLFPSDPSFPETVRPRGRTDASGKYQLWTYMEGDGVPAGKYKVTIVHNEVSVSKDTVVAKPNDLPVKYSRLDTTDLEVDIKPGQNSIPTFELK